MVEKRKMKCNEMQQDTIRYNKMKYHSQFSKDAEAVSVLEPCYQTISNLYLKQQNTKEWQSCQYTDLCHRASMHMFATQ